MFRISLIIPARNEVESIGATVRSFHTALLTETISHEIIVVDDGSTDTTKDAVKELLQEIPCLTLISRTGVPGFGSAVREGLAHAKGEYVALVMADGSDDPSDLINYSLKASGGYDCVFGSRFLRTRSLIHYPYWKYVLNRLGNLLIGVLFNLQYYDSTNAFKLYRKSRIDAFSLVSTGFELTVELPLKSISNDCSYAVIPISWRGREAGVTKMKILHVLPRYLFRVFQLWFNYVRLPIIIVATTWVLLMYYYVHIIVINTVNIPFRDQWTLVDILSHRFHLWETLAFQHNEHRIGFGLLLTQGLAYLTHWNQYWEIVLVNGFIIASLCIFSYFYYRARKRVCISDIFLPLVFLNVLQIENITWGFQIAFVFPLLLFSLWLLSFYLTTREMRPLCMTILSLFGAFSSLHGLIIPLFTLIYLLWSQRKEWIFIGVNVVIMCAYWIGFQPNFQTILTFIPSLDTFRFIAVVVSGGFFYFGDDFWINCILTGTTISTTLLGVLILRQSKKSAPLLVYGISAILFALVFIVCITVGRSAFGLGLASSSRYVSFSMLIPLGMFFIFSDIPNKGSIVKIFLIALLVVNINTFTQRIIEINTFTKGKQVILDCYLRAPVGHVTRCNDIFSLYPDRAYIDARTGTVRALKGMLH